MEFKFGDPVRVFDADGFYWKPVDGSVASHWIVFEHAIVQHFINDIQIRPRWIDCQSELE